MKVEIKKRFYEDRSGTGISYGVFVNGRLRKELFSDDELESFMKGLGEECKI